GVRVGGRSSPFTPEAAMGRLAHRAKRCLTSERRQPGPDVVRGPRARTGAGAGLGWRRAGVVEIRGPVDGPRPVTRLVDAPPNRVPGRAVRVVGADVAARAQVRRRLRRLGRALLRAAVVL